MPLSAEEVRHIAHLARLELTEDEVALYREQLSEILDYAEMIQALDTDAIPPTAQVIAQQGIMRSDAVEPSLSPEEVLANAHDSENGSFVVHAILEDS